MFGVHNTRKFIALDIGHSHLFAVRTKNGKVEEVAEAPLEKGIIENGEILKPDALTTALKKFWRDNKIKTRNVHISLASSRIKVALLDLQIDNLKKQEIDNTIKLNIFDKLQVEPEKTVLDYYISDIPPDAHGRRKIICVAAPKDYAMDYVRVVRRSGLNIDGIQAIPFVLPLVVNLDTEEVPEQNKDISNTPQVKKNNNDFLNIICNIGSEIASIGIYYKNECVYASFSSLGGNSITQAIANDLDISFEDAEELKCKIGLPLYPNTPQEVDVKNAAENIVDSISQEIYEIAEYYSQQPEAIQKQFDQVILTGGSASLKGLPQYIEAVMNINTRIGLPSNVIVPHERLFFHRWAVAYGLSLTNKMVEEIYKEKPVKPKKKSKKKKNDKSLRERRSVNKIQDDNKQKGSRFTKIRKRGDQ